MKHKKWLSIALTVILVMSLASCGKKPMTSSGESSDSSTESSTSSETSESGTQTSGQSVTETSVNGDGTTKASSQTTTKATTKPNGPSVIKNEITIKSGTKKMEEGLSFGGKTFTMACGIAPTNQIKRQIAAFQAKFNCKIVTETLDFAQYSQQVAAKIASGKSYDILQLEGSRFPNLVIANTCLPLEDTITTADWSNPSNMEAGGFSKDLSMAFAWNNHLYGVLGTRGTYAPSCNLIWYNKKILREAGTDDPRTLYDAGKWDFNAMKQIGIDVRKNTSAYLGGFRMLLGNIVSMNGGWYIKYSSDGSKPKSNLSDSRVINAYKYIQTLTTGNNASINVKDDLDVTQFFQGKMAFWVGAPYHLSANNEIAKNVENSNAFSKSLSNLGVVPLPFGSDNKEKSIGTGWLYGIAAGKGTSDKRVAVAWAKFATMFKDPVKDEYVWSAKDQAMINKLTDGKIIYRNYAFADASNNVNDLLMKMEGDIIRGGDIAQLTTTYNALFQNCIDVSISQQ